MTSVSMLVCEASRIQSGGDQSVRSQNTAFTVQSTHS